MSNILKVADIVNSIKTSIEFEYSQVQVQGEISNLSRSKTGHIYFTLSDKEAALSCAFFRGDALRNPILKTLQEGDEVILSGPINVYAKRGTFQLICKTIKKAGKGDLRQQFEILKQKLLKEGLFEAENKVSIPSFPSRIAVITAANGAAVQDFVNIVKRRSLWCDILIFPTLVQGERAPRSILKSLKRAESYPEVDLIVLARGGGSIEDLWAFNDEELVRAVFKCKKPVISAVGHQVDFCLTDFVADLRAETPSAAAEIITEKQNQLQTKLKHLIKAFGHSFWQFKFRVSERIEKVNPTNLAFLLERNLNKKKLRLDRFNKSYFTSLLSFSEYELKTEDLLEKLLRSSENKHQSKLNKLELFSRSLNALNPSNVLERGYSFLKTSNSVITSQKDFDKLESKTSLSITFHDGVGHVQKP